MLLRAVGSRAVLAAVCVAGCREPAHTAPELAIVSSEYGFQMPRLGRRRRRSHHAAERGEGHALVHEGPIDQMWGTREFYVEDPDGNTLRFTRPAAA